MTKGIFAHICVSAFSFPTCCQQKSKTSRLKPKVNPRLPPPHLCRHQVPERIGIRADMVCSSAPALPIRRRGFTGSPCLKTPIFGRVHFSTPRVITFGRLRIQEEVVYLVFLVSGKFLVPNWPSVCVCVGRWARDYRRINIDKLICN